MTVHLVKLCVGADSVEDLEAWVAECRAEAEAAHRPYEQIHRTRSTPRRAEEILDGGSLYWVIRGVVRARQRIVDIRTGEAAGNLCELVLSPEIVRTAPRPQRPFQGWRYLDPAAAPPDIAAAPGGAVPEPMRSALAELCLL